MRIDDDEEGGREGKESGNSRGGKGGIVSCIAVFSANGRLL